MGTGRLRSSVPVPEAQSSSAIAKMALGTDHKTKSLGLDQEQLGPDQEPLE